MAFSPADSVTWIIDQQTCNGDGKILSSSGATVALLKQVGSSLNLSSMKGRSLINLVWDWRDLHVVVDGRRLSFFGHILFSRVDASSGEERTYIQLPDSNGLLEIEGARSSGHDERLDFKILDHRQSSLNSLQPPVVGYYRGAAGCNNATLQLAASILAESGGASTWILVSVLFLANMHRRVASLLTSPVARITSPVDALLPPAVAAVLVRHDASCDFCATMIEGMRYKCQGCPDFDVCGACFEITGEQHPGHAFVKITTPSDYKMVPTVPKAYHRGVICNGCDSSIVGSRFKCVHCPNYDLCENCEAAPFQEHPIHHHLLKLKIPDDFDPSFFLPPSTVAFKPRTQVAASPPAVDLAAFLKKQKRRDNVALLVNLGTSALSLGGKALLWYLASGGI